MGGKKCSIGLKAALSAFTVSLFVTSTWAASQEMVLHSFNGRNGNVPFASLIFDAAGNLYGTTALGGSGACNYGRPGCGTVFELTPKTGGGWTEKVLYNFKDNKRDGTLPHSSLIFDGIGNLYGTTNAGGPYARGTVFELMPKAGGGWAEKVLHSFNGTDGAGPTGLIFDGAGNLYGTTGAGTVFELIPKAGGGWKEKVLHSFGGEIGVASLIMDAAGNLYGTTIYGGAYRKGTVFELTPKADGGWTEKVLHQFKKDGKDGFHCWASLIFDTSGNLFGTTIDGGAHNKGVVFELTPTAGGRWTENVLHDFSGNGKDGSRPPVGLILDAAGNLYGTTTDGGTYGDGTVFELMPTTGGGWTENVLHNFSNIGGDGMQPAASLILDAAGNLYGTTQNGGADGDGTVFEITP
jgi:uncharacterized repeat protein (TIGR03803 family)